MLLVEIVKKGTSYLAFFMTVFGRLNAALDKCNANQTASAIQSLDEGVAFYTGSLEGTDANSNTSTGVLLFNQARQRCRGFRTCGAAADSITGNAKVNIDVFSKLNEMKANLLSGNCIAARLSKEAIVRTILIIFIQGSLRYANIQSGPIPGSPKAEAEGIMYASALLPFVAKCNSTAATYVFDELKPNTNYTANFAGIKSAYESTYLCLGIKCADVGGLINTTTNGYLPGRDPCVDKTRSPTRAPTKAPVNPPTAVTPSTPTVTPPTPTVTPPTPTVTPPTPTAIPPTLNPPTPTARPGFFRRIFRRIRSFFRGLFGL
jgi:hypothetical protein